MARSIKFGGIRTFDKPLISKKYFFPIIHSLTDLNIYESSSKQNFDNFSFMRNLNKNLFKIQCIYFDGSDKQICLRKTTFLLITTNIAVSLCTFRNKRTF